MTAYPVGVSGVSVAARCICSEIHHSRTLLTAQWLLWSTLSPRVSEEMMQWCQGHSVEVLAESCPPLDGSVQRESKALSLSFSRSFSF